MSETRTVRLGDVCQVVSGATPKTSVEEYWDGDINWVTPADLSKLSGAYISETPRKITEAGFNSCATNLLPENSVLLSSRAPIGHVAINTVPMATNQGFKSLIPGDQILPKFLYYWLIDHKEYLQSLGVGATFKELSKKTVENIKLDLPPLEEQAKQVKIRDLQSTIAQKRERQQELLKELKTAVFSTMFEGKDYPILSLNEISLGKGTYGANLASEEYNSDKPRYIRITDINDDGSLNNDLRSPAGSNSDWEKYILKPGDLLFARSGATVGKTFLVQDETQKAIHAGYLIKFKLNRNLVNPDYIFSYTQTPAYRAWVKSKQNVVAQPNINAKQYGQELKIPIPPLAHQNKFSKIIGKI